MIRFCKLTCALVLFCQLSGAAFAQRELKEIPLPDPELSLGTSKNKNDSLRSARVLMWATLRLTRS